ncbi:MAG: DegT/DnrJ/EryC1/StrS family aminotransferase [Kiritimatiellia bacterium]|nr:DegT/DnrJ/EryC1/StrS family aminotransferase [Kiritimatiellia bacterium]
MNKRIFLSPPWLGGQERARVEEAFASGYLAPCGPMVERFEREFAEAVGAPYACAVSSGTAALELLFHELGVTRGDRVFCSDLTFVSSIAPAVRRGAEPVFLDSDEATWTMDPGLLEEALARAAKEGRLPKAVVAVDLYGQCCDYLRIGAACARYGVPLILDAAEALGAVYCDNEAGAKGRGKGENAERRTPNAERRSGGERGENAQRSREEGGRRSAADAAWAVVYSFNGNKIITTSGGGMIVSRDAGVIERARKRSQQAREPVVWYEHEELGYNFRMSNIVAAIGVGQLEALERILAQKRRIFGWYREMLEGRVACRFMPEAAYGRCTRWLTVIELLRPRSGGSSFVHECMSSLVGGKGENAERSTLNAQRSSGEVREKCGNAGMRECLNQGEGKNAERGTQNAECRSGGPGAEVLRVIAALESDHIEARPVWKPMHLQPVFRDARIHGGAVSERLFANGVCLPSGAGLERAEVIRISERIGNCLIG